MKFIVNDKSLEIKDYEQPNSGSINDYLIDIEFSNEWNNLNKVARIIIDKQNEGIERAVINNKVYIDMEKQHRYTIGFIGFTVEYNLTEDTEIDTNKTYYTRSGEEGAYIYTKVENPVVADIETYYEEVKTYQKSTNLVAISYHKGAGQIETKKQDIPTQSEWETYIAQIQDMIDGLENEIPTKLSDLTNDNNTVTDANYVHTDNNYTTNEKTKLAGLENYNDAEIKQDIVDLNINKADKTEIPDKLSDLSDDSTHRLVTDTEKSTWNDKGTYSKPSNGIPKTDLESSVQTSLAKADSSIQDISGKQDTLVSGINIKTINNENILGSGNITIQGGGGSTTDVQINGTSIVNNNVANIVTKTAYNASSNKLATENDLPDISGKQNTIDSSHKLSADLVDDTSTTNKFVTSTDISNWNDKGTYSKPSGGIPKTDLAEAVQTSLEKADTALQTETYTGTITSVKMNGTTIASSGEADLGTVITQHQDISGKQNITDNTLTTTNKTVPTAINEVNSIAKGANQALSYSNYSSMVTSFNALDDDIYNIGQNVMIITLEVPDLWISGIESTSSTYTYVDDATIINALQTNGYIQVGYYKLSMLETQKVDLTNYVTTTSYATNLVGGVVRLINAFGVGAGASSDVIGCLYAITKSYSEYENMSNLGFIGKGTLENVLTAKSYEITSNKVASATGLSSNSTDTQYPSAKCVYDYIQSLDATEVAY